MPTDIDIPADILLRMKDLELKTLLETIQAINSNASEHVLARIYSFTIRANKSISKMALYVLNPENSLFEFFPAASFGTLHQYRYLPLPQAVLDIRRSTQAVAGIPFFEEFDQIIPIWHQTKTISYLFLGFSGKEDNEGSIPLEISFLEALCSVVVAAIYNRKIEKQKTEDREYANQLEIAKEVQGLLVPKKLPKQGKLQIEATYQPHHRIGGDYYDCIKLDANRWLLCVADVSGKGVPAALIMSNFQAGLRLLSKKEASLTTVVQELNSFVAEVSSEGRFITAFFAIYDMSKEQICYINAGHNPPFYWSGGEWRRLTEGCTVLGAFPKLPKINEEVVAASPPFFLFAFTDGFVESPAVSNGLPLDEDYLQKFLNNYLYEDLQYTHQKLMRLINNATEGEAKTSIDDITLLSLRVLPS